MATSTYRTRSGDTWDAIALRALGDEIYMCLMIDANPEHNYVARFGEGVILNVPDLPPTPPRSTLPPWRLP